MTGIIELDADSITLSIYRFENNVILKVLSIRSPAGLNGYIESCVLTPKGIQKACSVLSQYSEILSNLKVENTVVFASAFIESVSNSEEAIILIHERTGYHVKPISGEEKAELGYFGTAQSIPLNTGLFVNVGGGSTEVAVFENRRILQAWSIPYGSLNLSLKYVKGITPLKSHIQSIKKDLKRELKRIKPTESTEQRDICVRGTAEAARDLYNDIYDLADNHVLDSEKLAHVLMKYNEERRDINKRIKNLCPDRIHTLVPGMTILNTLAGLWHSRYIYVTAFGVSDGYYLKNVMHADKRNDFSQI